MLSPIPMTRESIRPLAMYALHREVARGTEGASGADELRERRARTRGKSQSSAMLNAFTVDVEDYFHVSALASAIPRSSWETRECRVADSTDRLLAMLADRGVTGTFFVLGWVAAHIPQLVRRIADQGHEIACHGYSHQLVYAQTQDTFRQETRCAKWLLEDLTGRPVVGYRAASFSITPKSRWALDTLIELGFEYDSSIFPVRHDRYGMPGASRSPGWVESPSRGSIVEFPMSTASFGGMRIPVSGGGYFRLFPYWFVRSGLRRINRDDRMPFTFYLHPWEIDAEQPRVRVGLLSRVRHYTNLHKCEARLRRLLGEFRFTSMRNVLQQCGLLASQAR
jgi:polysaccharide deacetylase family protein (PEP-CTERM system associated)